MYRCKQFACFSNEAQILLSAILGHIPRRELFQNLSQHTVLLHQRTESSIFCNSESLASRTLPSPHPPLLSVQGFAVERITFFYVSCCLLVKYTQQLAEAAKSGRSAFPHPQF